jgi:hypothetical protein
MLITANNKKNPNTKEMVLFLSFLSSECPTTTGINGKTHGDSTETIPAEKEIK